jgi:VanZ family protein
MITIFILSTMSGKQLPQITWVPSPDKWAHATVYALLATGLWYSTTGIMTSEHNRYGLAFGIAAGYGIGMEIVQYSFFPARYFEVWDIVANIIGAFGALVILRKFFNH